MLDIKFFINLSENFMVEELGILKTGVKMVRNFFFPFFTSSISLFLPLITVLLAVTAAEGEVFSAVMVGLNVVAVENDKKQSTA